VLFISEEENLIPSTVNVPTRDDLEENRGMGSCKEVHISAPLRNLH